MEYRLLVVFESKVDLGGEEGGFLVLRVFFFDFVVWIRRVMFII